MRVIGQIESEAAARRFGDFLYVQRIPNQVDSGSDGRWDVWVHADDDLEKGKQWLDLFRQNPEDQKFAVGRKADDLRAIEAEAQERFRRRMKSRGDVFRRFVAHGLGPLTVLLIGGCIGMYVWGKFSPSAGFANLFSAEMFWDRVHGFYFSEFLGDKHIAARMLCSPEIRGGQIWRLFTPIFLHFGILHIFFNMMWMRDLGSAIEMVEGTWKLLLLVLVSAALSNWAQYVITGDPRFGGISGVVYALFGYVWMKSKYDPGAGLFLHKQTVTMMLIWLAVGFTGILPIANYVHLGGLLTGVIWGFTESRLLR